MTHELRTSLTALRLHGDLLADARIANDPVRRAAPVNAVRDGPARLAHLIDNVLDYARLERRRPPTPREVTLDSLLGDVRNAKLLSDPRFATLKARDVEIAMGKLAARADESARTQGQVTGMLSEVPDAAAALGAQARAVVASLREIQSLMSDRFRADLVVDLATMRGIASSVVAVVPEIAQTEVASEATSDQKVEVTAEPASRRGGVFSVDTRADALRAIELVCAYLERNEPTNPAQFLLHRAARVIDKNFLQLVKELAPDSMKDVAKIMGIDPATVTDLN
mgnify:CR=1 FL=1